VTNGYYFFRCFGSKLNDTSDSSFYRLFIYYFFFFRSQLFRYLLFSVLTCLTAVVWKAGLLPGHRLRTYDFVE
jgi:predicted RND superfamily exporter protein